MNAVCIKEFVKINGKRVILATPMRVYEMFPIDVECRHIQFKDNSGKYRIMDKVAFKKHFRRIDE